jgi:LysM repeat protein
MKHLVLLLSFIFCTLASAQVNTRQTKEQYIEKYKAIAISEMIRTGVPASITLAQGILESSSGNSQLSTEAKNHFGIKCHKDWKGPKMYMDDDTIGECFRVYGSAEESFTDHSNFLRTRPRYSFLFDLDKTDYRGWALGLKKAGYATNPNYAQLLIDLIEKMQLMQYDLVDENGLKNIVQQSKPIPKQHLDVKIVKQIIKYNEIDAYAVQKNDEGPLSIADKFQMMPWQIYKYNDLPKEKFLFEPGEVVYLKPKRRKARTPYHKVGATETLWQISQLYGIRLSSLRKKNQLEEGQEPAEGSILFLRKKAETAPKTRTIQDIEKRKIQLQPKIDSTPKYQPGDTIVKKPSTISGPTNDTIPKKVIVPPKPIDSSPISTPKNQLPEFHTVIQGETAYSISKKYGINVEDLLQRNSLKSPTLKLGQQLKIKP